MGSSQCGKEGRGGGGLFRSHQEPLMALAGQC